MKNWIFWDFDGTLGFREGMFSGALFKVLNEKFPDNNIMVQDISKELKSGFPWHNPENSYESLSNPKAWWDYVENIFYNAYINCGIGIEASKELSVSAHFEYINPDSFRLFPDTVEVLKYFKDHGWSNAILSNHVPELPTIIDSLGLSHLVEYCISSANIGYEKPNKMFFQKSLSIIGEIQDSWMIGDSYNADVKGAENSGIKAILVRSKIVEGVKYYSRDLLGLKDIIVCSM